MPQEDKQNPWSDFLKSVKPLKHRQNRCKKELPPRLKARKAVKEELLFELDLHGKTVQEAYQLCKLFVNLHYKKGSKQISIITGKGLKNTGVIKNEIALWFETKDFQDKISSYVWINDGGVVKIMLKRNKEICRKKLF